MVVFGHSGCIRVKVVVIGQSGCLRSKMVVFVPNGCMRARRFCSIESGCIRARVFVIGFMYFYSGKVVVFGQKMLYWSKSGCIQLK